MNLGDEANAPRNEQDLDAKRHVQRARLKTRLTLIAVTWLVLSALAVAVALGGALKTSYTSTSNTHIAFGLFMVLFALALLVGLYAYLAYSRRIRLPVDQPVARRSRRGDDTDQRFNDFLAATKLPTATVPTIGAHGPDELVTPSRHQASGEATTSSESTEGLLDGVNRGDDPGPGFAE